MRGQNQKKSKMRAVIRNFSITFVLLLVLAGIAIPLARKIKLDLSAASEVGRIESEISRLERENSELKRMIDYFGTDEYIESAARTSLNYRKPEEKVAVIFDQNSEGKDPAGIRLPGTSASPEARPAGNPARWRYYFFADSRR